MYLPSVDQLIYTVKRANPRLVYIIKPEHQLNSRNEDRHVDVDVLMGCNHFNNGVNKKSKSQRYKEESAEFTHNIMCDGFILLKEGKCENEAEGGDGKWILNLINAGVR